MTNKTLIPIPTTTLVVPKALKPELIAKIAEVENKLKALPPIKTQADADTVNKVVKESNSLAKLISAERMEITRPLNEVIDYVIGMERDAISTMTAMTDIKKKNLTDFAKEQERLAALERERIRKEAEENSRKEQARVSGIMATIGQFEKSAHATINTCTLENIDSKIKGLTNLKFDPKIYQEFIDNVEALRQPLLEKLALKKLQLLDLAELAKKDADKAAQEAIAIAERDKQALEDIDLKTAQNTETAKMDVLLNEQMGAELKESTIQGAKSVQKVWILGSVLNLMDVPFEFLMLDEKKVKAAIKAGRHSISGLEIIQDIRNVAR